MKVEPILTISFQSFISIGVGQDFCYIWWLLTEPFFVSQSSFKLWVSSQSSWAAVQPGCWEEHLPVRWWHQRAVQFNSSSLRTASWRWRGMILVFLLSRAALPANSRISGSGASEPTMDTNYDTTNCELKPSSVWAALELGALWHDITTRHDWL